MIITKDQIQQMIDEEFERALARRKKLAEAPRRMGIAGEASLYNIDSSELIEFCKAYASLGNAVQDQLIDILDNAETDDVNPNAILMIKDYLGGMNEEIDNAIEAWNEHREEVEGRDIDGDNEEGEDPEHVKKVLGSDDDMDELDEVDLDQKAPPGGERVVKALKKKKNVKNPWAVAWAMKNRGEI
jgi:hypothetical protein